MQFLTNRGTQLVCLGLKTRDATDTLEAVTLGRNWYILTAGRNSYFPILHHCHNRNKQSPLSHFSLKILTLQHTKVYKFLIPFVRNFKVIAHYKLIRIISATNFNAQFSVFVNNMFVTLLSSTCFEHQHAHLQEEKLYSHSIWYLHSL